MMTDKKAQKTGAKIKICRLRAGLSQAGLAQRAGISPNTVARLERGEHRPTLATIEALAHALSVTVSDLLR